MMIAFSRRTSAGAAILLAAVLSVASAEPEHSSVQGRYSGLMQKISCPSDRELYGQFFDYGWWSAASYCGQRVVSGWWVYAEPYWYVWRRNREMPKTRPRPASLDGKYGGLLMAVICPQDKADYGEFNDWGYWEAERYCGQRVKPGYWVYLFPYWYVWRVINL